MTSISKHADLEDQIFALTSQRDEQKDSIEELERAKAQWEESMNTGLLVERSAIREEMQRLATGLVEEERRRGSAEEKREQVENEVDALTATLFEQANTMVATERMSRAQAEERLKETEENLAAAESAMRDMQQHLQSLSVSASPAAPEGESTLAPPVPRRFLASHPPYAEFHTLLQHLRALRPTARQRARDPHREFYPAPLVSTLLAQPFLARCVAEDHEPTLRLEQAATLGWVSRRSVGAAVISGDLVIEPVSISTLGPPEAITCALCGRGLFSNHPNPRSLLKLFASPGTPSTPSSSSTSIYVFRAATTDDAKSYPLCRNGWCLERLRAACALWHFIRTSLVTPVWYSEDGVGGSVPTQVDIATPPEADKLSVSPRPQPPRSASGGRVTVDALAGAEARYEPRRKSGWGLGFKQPSWSWSRPGTPGNSVPTTPAPGEGGEGGEGESEEKNGLGAPIELGGREGEAEDKGEREEGKEEPEPKQDKGELKEEHNGEAKEEPEPKEPEEPKAKENNDESNDAEAEDKDGSKGEHETEPPLTPSASHISASTSDAGSFATPAGEHQPLAEEAGEEGGSKEAEDGESKEPESQNPESQDPQETEHKAEGEEVTETDGSTPTEDKPAVDEAAVDKPAAADAAEVADTADAPPPPPRAAGRAPPPPPLPKRSAARGPTPPITPTDAATPTDISTPTALATPISRPPRRSLERERPTQDHDRTFITGDGWEIRAWKQVIKLKEDMWRARVGVVE